MASNAMQLHYMTVDTTSGSESEHDECSENEVVPSSRIQILSRGRLVLLNAAWFGMMMTFLVLAIAVVPSQIQYLVGERQKAKTLSLVAAAGSVVTLISAPIIGFFSDRCQSQFGRRRPFMVVGTFLICIFLVGVAYSAPHFAHSRRELHQNASCTSFEEDKPHCPATKSLVNEDGHGTQQDLGFFIASYLLVFFGYSLVSTTYNGLIADMTHPSVRGFSSGVMGLLMLFGNLFGAGLGAVSQSLHVPGTYAVVGVVFFSTVMLTVLTVQEVPTAKTEQPALDVRKILISYIQPLRNHDFFWVFVTRFLMQMGIASTMGFLEYWLDDVVELPDCMPPVKAVSLALLPLLIVAALSSLAGGALADKIQRKKPIVISSALVMSIAAGGLIVTQKYWLAVLISVVFGCGLGAYTAVDFALVMDVLPNERDRAKDLAIWHQALVLPQLIATPIGGVIVHKLQEARLSNGQLGCERGVGYIVLFAISAAYFLLSGAFITRIRSVR